MLRIALLLPVIIVFGFWIFNYKYFWAIKTVALFLLSYTVIYYSYLKSFYRKRPRIIPPVPTIIRSSSIDATVESMEKEPEPPFLLSSFISSNIKVFGFLSPDSLQMIADNAEEFSLRKGERFNPSESLLLLKSGTVRALDKQGISFCTLTGPCALSSLFQVAAHLIGRKNDRQFDDYTFEATEECSLVKVHFEAVSLLKNQIAHILQVILTRLRKVTFAVVESCFVNFQPEVEKLKKALYLKVNFPEFDPDMPVEAIIEKFPYTIKTACDVTHLKSGEEINEPFWLLRGQVEAKDESYTAGFCNILGCSLFKAETFVISKDSLVMKFTPDALNNLFSDVKLLTDLFTKLMNNISSEFFAMDSVVRWRRLDAGAECKCQAEVKLILHGRLQVAERTLIKGDSYGEDKVVRDFSEPFSVNAMRETELVSIPVTLYKYFANIHASVANNLSKRIMDSLLEGRNLPKSRSIKTVAIIPATQRYAHLSVLFVESVMRALKATESSCIVLDSSTVLDTLGKDAFTSLAKLKLDEYISEQEDSHRLVVMYSVDGPRNYWTRKCLKQADLILTVVDAMDEGNSRILGENELLIRELKITAKCELILIHDEMKRRSSGTREWLSSRSWIQSHSHIYLEQTKRRKVSIQQAATPINRFTLGGRQKLQQLLKQMRRNPFEDDRFLPKPEDTSEDIDITRLARKLLGNRVGLVLSGGGARGFAHVGVIRALREAGIDFDVVGGCSMGALVGALYADQSYSCYALPTLVRYFAERASSWWRQALDLTIPLIAWFTGHHFNRTIWKLLGELCIDDLWIDYFCVSTDLKNQCLRVHRRGSDSDDYLWRFVRASMTLCGILPPIPDRAGNILVDGGYLNNLPVDICLEEPFNADVVIAVDISSGSQLNGCTIPGDTVSGTSLVLGKLFGYSSTNLKVPSFTQLQAEIVYLANSQQEKRLLGDPRVVMVQPPVQEYGVLEFEEWRDIIQIGYEYTQTLIAQWRLDGTIDRLIPNNPGGFPPHGHKRRKSF